MMRYIAALLLFVAAASATDFRNCTALDGSIKPVATAVEVSGCETMPCDFVRGTYLISDIHFTAGFAVDQMEPNVWVTIDGIPFPYPLPFPDACASLTQGACPLYPGDLVTYHLIMPIEPSYPSVSMTIEFNLRDANTKDTVVCIEMDGVVVG